MQYVSWEAVECGQKAELVTEVINRCWHFRYRHVDQSNESRYYYEGVGFGLTAQQAANNMCQYMNQQWAWGMTIIQAKVAYDMYETHMLPIERKRV